MNRLIYFLPLFFIVLLVGLLVNALLTHQDIVPSPLEQKPLPAFSLPMPDGGTLTSDKLKGRYTLLNIFASWCASCRVEHPYLMTLSKQIPIYGIAWKDEKKNTINWLKKHGNPYTAVGLDIKGDTILDLGVTGAPETFLISPEGTVLFRYPGPLSEAIVKESILPLMKKPTPAARN